MSIASGIAHRGSPRLRERALERADAVDELVQPPQPRGDLMPLAVRQRGKRCRCTRRPRRSIVHDHVAPPATIVPSGMREVPVDHRRAADRAVARRCACCPRCPRSRRSPCARPIAAVVPDLDLVVELDVVLDAPCRRWRRGRSSCWRRSRSRRRSPRARPAGCCSQRPASSRHAEAVGADHRARMHHGARADDAARRRRSRSGAASRRRRCVTPAPITQPGADGRAARRPTRARPITACGPTAAAGATMAKRRPRAPSGGCRRRRPAAGCSIAATFAYVA